MRSIVLVAATTISKVQYKLISALDSSYTTSSFKH